MYTKWTEHLKTDREKSDFQKSVQASKYILDRLLDILEEVKLSLETSEINLNNYDNSGWAFKQAHINGQKASLDYIKKLINLDQQRRT